MATTPRRGTPAPLGSALAFAPVSALALRAAHALQKLGALGVRQAKKRAARAKLVLLNHEELGAELGALDQAHLALRVRGAGHLAHNAVPCWHPRLTRF